MVRTWQADWGPRLGENRHSGTSSSEFEEKGGEAIGWTKDDMMSWEDG